MRQDRREPRQERGCAVGLVSPGVFATFLHRDPKARPTQTYRETTGLCVWELRHVPGPPTETTRSTTTVGVHLSGAPTVSGCRLTSRPVTRPELLPSPLVAHLR